MAYQEENISSLFPPLAYFDVLAPQPTLWRQYSPAIYGFKLNIAFPLWDMKLD
jgi:hypothetical protein